MTTLTYYTELAAVEAEPKRAPDIGNFAQAIDRELYWQGLDRDDFNRELEARRDDAGEWLENLSEARLQHHTGLTDAICDRMGLREHHFNQLAEYLFANSPEFKSEFAHAYLPYICRAVHERREREARVLNQRGEE